MSKTHQTTLNHAILIYMEPLIKADIFFFIASASTVIITILLALLLFYVIKAGRNLYKLSEVLKEGVKDSEDFVLELKERLEDNMIFRMFFPPAKKRRKNIGK